MISETEKYVQGRLLELKDEKYREFQCKLMPTVDRETVIGVRTPQLRAFAKEFVKTPAVEEFIKKLPHAYFEENNLHGFIIETIKDYDRCVEEIERFLPYVDNWATCDLISPKIFKKHLPVLLERIKVWIKSDLTYTVRFGVEMLMSFYLDEHYDSMYPDLVCCIRSDEYYIKMMVAWYFATALAKQYDDVIPYIEQRRLDKWTHNKSIQKAIESYRITDEQKAYLKSMKIK